MDQKDTKRSQPKDKVQRRPTAKTNKSEAPEVLDRVQCEVLAELPPSTPLQLDYGLFKYEVILESGKKGILWCMQQLCIGDHVDAVYLTSMGGVPSFCPITMFEQHIES